MAIAEQGQDQPLRIINGDRQTGLRLAEPGDGQFLQALFFAVKGESFAPASLPAPVLDNLLQQQFHARNHAYQTMYPEAEQWIILRDCQPVGQFILAHKAPAHRHLVDIAMLPDWRGRGLATDVLTTLKDHLKRKGKACLTLSVVSTNPAIRLYRRLGFVEKGPADGISITMACRCDAD